jgi:hypothetical protein
LKSETEATIEKREQEIEKSGESSTSTEQFIAQVDPEYGVDLKAIQSNTRLTEAEKLGKTQMREKELLSQIDKELVSINQKLKADPANAELINRKEQLTELKSIIESRIEERVQLIESLATSDVTPEQMEALKQEVLKGLDPAYEKKKSTLLAQTAEKPYTELISLEEKLLTKLEAERIKVEKVLAKDPTNKEANQKLKVIESLIEETQAEKERWIKEQKGDQPVVVTDAEKKDLVKEIAPEYAENRKSFEAQSNKTEEDLKEQLARENELLSEIQAKIQADEMVLSEEPENTVLAKELKVLEALKGDVEERISDIDKQLEVIPSAEKTFTSSEINAKINDLDPEFESKQREIEANTNLTELERLEELNSLDRLLQNQVLEKINELETRLASDPRNNELEEEKRLLEVIAEQLEKNIQSREDRIDSLRSTEPLTKGLNQEWIDQLDKTYRQDVKFIEENKSFDQLKKLELIQQKDLALMNKVDERLEALSRIPEPKLAEVKNEEKALAELKVTLLQRTEDRAKEIDRLKKGVVALAPQKSDLIEELVPGFDQNKKAIEEDAGLDNELKKDMIVQLEEVLQQKTEQRIEEVNERLLTDPSDLQAQKEKELLQEIISESKERVKDAQMENLISDKQRDMIISELFPDYASKKNELAISKMEESKKIDAQLVLENQLLTKLKTEVRSVQKQLDKDPSNETLIQKLKELNLLIGEQEKVISELNQRKVGLASVEIAETAIRNADKTYLDDLKKIDEQADGPAKRNALAEREAQHQENLSEQIAANEKLLAKKEDPELQASNVALKNELSASEEREEVLRSADVEDSQLAAKERTYIENLREDLLSGNAEQLTAKNTTVEELKQQDLLLAQYEADLKKEIESLKKEIATEPENEELKQELSWLNKELSIVQQKRREISITVGELETELITERSTDAKVTSPELEELVQEEQKIEQQLKQNDLTSTER